MIESEIINLISNNIPTVISTIETVTAGIFTAIFLRKKTSSVEFEKIKAGKFKEVADDLLNSGKMTYTEYYKANNFLMIAEKADQIYNNMPKNNDPRKYNFDWLIRFYETVGSISDEDMQNFWAKILAGEINKPMSFSLKTIDILKNLNKDDADLFIKICSHVIINGENWFLPNYNEYLDKYNIKYSDIMKLSELGLIYNNGFITSNINLDKKAILIHEDYILMNRNENAFSSRLSIKQFPLTIVGKEILSLRYNVAPIEDLLLFTRIINKKNDIKISVHKIMMKDGNNVKFQETDLLK